jgi:hypothetical protein
MILFRLVAIIGILVGIAHPAYGDKHGEQYGQYRQGAERASEYFLALYKEYGARNRHSVILLKCGYKKEADELDVKTRALEKKKLDDLLDSAIKDRTFRSMEAVSVAWEGTQSMLVGYRIGYTEALSLTADSIPSRIYESLCKSSLQKVRAWLEEDK